MPTDKPKIIFVVEKELLQMVDDFRARNDIVNRSEAVRQLIKKSLKMDEVFSDETNAEILFAALEGQNNKEIAEDLGIPERQVRRIKRAITFTLSEWVKTGSHLPDIGMTAPFNISREELKKYNSDGSVKRRIKFKKQSSSSD